MPEVVLSINIVGSTIVSECDNVQLSAVLLSQCIYPLQFKWVVLFSNAGSLSSSQQQEALNYFSTFSTFSSTTGINIPSRYIASNCILDVVLYAQTTGGSGLTTAMTKVTVKPNVPTIKFTERPQDNVGFSSAKPTIIAFVVSNRICNGGSRLLQSSSIIPVTIDFKLYSGLTSSSSTTRNLNEIQIEQTLSALYSKYQSINANFSQGFKYNIYYRLVITVTDTNTNTPVYDSLTFYFYKPAVTAVIDSVGGIVSIIKDLTLNGSNSIIPESDGDIIAYNWDCLSATPISSNTTCVCPTLTSYNLQSKELIIVNSKIQNLCKYSYSLTVSATSSSGQKRTHTAQTEFIAFKSSVLPIKGKTIEGYMNNVKDIYFTSQIASTCPDSQLTYEWSLIQVESLVPLSGEKYSKKNTFIYNYLKRIGVNVNSSLTMGDIEIPELYKPQYLTSMTDRIMGVNVKSMVERTRYLFAVIVTYPTTPSFEFLSYDVPPQPRKRIFTISPTTGVGMETSFSLLFTLPKTTDVDQAQYQILRRDCPSSANKATPVTQVLGTTSSFTGIFAPGQESCNFQVEIIVRAIEYDSSIEMNSIVTIKNPEKPATDVVADCLGSMNSNSKFTTPNQRLSLMGEVANIRVTESSESGKNSVNTMLDLTSQLDSATGGVRDLMDKSQLPSLFNATASTMGNLLTTQVANVDESKGLNVSSKVSSYLKDISSVTGGSQILPACLNSLSSVAGVGEHSKSNNSYYSDLQQTVNQAPAMKLKEAVAGAPAYSVSYPKLELVVKNSYASAFNASQATKTSKGSQMDMPAGLSDTFLNSIPDSGGKTNNTVTFGTSVNAISYNPYVDVKSSSSLNASSITNGSSNIVSPETVVEIYKDLQAGKLDNVVDTTKQTSDILQVAFTPLVIDKTGSSVNSNSTIEIGTLPNNKQVKWTLPTKGDPTSSLTIPMYYLEEEGVWTNQGCSIAATSNKGIVEATCDNLGGKSSSNVGKSNGLSKLPIVVAKKKALRIAMDLVEDFVKVLRSGNYKMLYNFGAFTNASWENYMVFAGVGLAFIIYVILVFYYHKQDKLILHNERMAALKVKLFPRDEVSHDGVIYKVFSFFSKLKKKGIKQAIETTGEPNSQLPPIQRDSTQKVTTMTKEKKKIPNGYSLLDPHEEDELKHLYKFHLELKDVKHYDEKQLYESSYNTINSNKVLSRITQSRLDDIIVIQPTVFSLVLVSILHIYIYRVSTLS